VFATSGHAIEQSWQHLRGRAGLPDLRFHDLRHEAVSRLFEKGLNLLEVSAVSGESRAQISSYAYEGA
jgi:integrase